MAWTTEQTITLQETVSVVTKKTVFKLTIGSSSAPATSWGGNEVVEEIYFKISDLKSEKNASNWAQWRLSSLKVKESNGRTITISNQYSRDEDGYIEVLSDKDELINSNYEFSIERGDDDYGSISLDFKYVWYEQEYNLNNKQIGAFSYQSTEEYTLNYEIEDDYKDHICNYTISSSNYRVLFFDQTIPIKYNIYLTAKQLWRPKVSLKHQLSLTNLNDSNLSYTADITLVNGVLKDCWVYFDAEIETKNFIDVVFSKEDDNIIIEPLLFNSSTNKILIHFSKNPAVNWSATGSYGTCSATIELNHPNGYIYNCAGTFNFYEQEAPTDELVAIEAIQYFFKGFGFYYNFERGITQNQFYYNMPYWFYLFKSPSLTNNENNALETWFFKRTPQAGEESLENAASKKKENSCFTYKKTEIYLFRKYSQKLSGITVTFSGAASRDSNLPYTDHFFQEGMPATAISCYDSQTVLIWYKGEGASSEYSKISRRNQALNNAVVNRYFPTENTVFIDGVAIKSGFQTLTTYYNAGSPWSRYVITSNFSINLIERNVLNKNFIKKTEVQLKDISGGEKYTDLLTAFLAKPTIILSNFVPSLEKIYSIEFSITLQNLEETKTFQNECCSWVPFQYSFSTEPVYLSYDPLWVEKTYSIADQHEKGLYRKEEEGTIFRTPGTLEIEEGEIYYECLDSEGNKSAFYNQTDLLFFPNYVYIPFVCSIPLNLFFSLQNNEGEYNYNVLLNKLKDISNQKLIEFPTVGAGLVEYKQQGLNNNEWESADKVFSESGLPGSLIKTRRLDYTFPQEIVSSDEFNSNMILTAFISSPLSFKLTEISPSYPIFFRSDLDMFYIEWEYPPLGKIPTVAYRKNRIGINTLRVDEEENQILVMEQIGENEARYITFYNLEGVLTFQVDLQTGNYYFSGQQMSGPLI